MNYKRKRSKNQRAGCLLCKPWKINGAGDSNRMESKHTYSENKRIKAMEDELQNS